MTVTIKIDTSNAAFEPSTGDETARILKDIAAKLEDGSQMIYIGEIANLYDANGNRVGSFKVSH